MRERLLTGFGSISWGRQTAGAGQQGRYRKSRHNSSELVFSVRHCIRVWILLIINSIKQTLNSVPAYLFNINSPFAWVALPFRESPWLSPFSLHL